ncbi:MAG: 16S rRNA (guanine(527)-N(7))-methyltransferase RsmG, partial [Aestuariibacter sp.]|nr:16S rRNA (guanine(527)-N(7))-methyltransferase RsmG [Aestuariibacter sp.]MCP4950018.1 16S rRNA (guanine(527)-N(7))-methyltransferase RsmG [Aestuariibacter sp.]
MSIDHQVLHQILSDGLSTMDLTLTSEQQQKLIDYVARI